MKRKNHIEINEDFQRGNLFVLARELFDFKSFVIRYVTKAKQLDILTLCHLTQQHAFK